MNHRNTYSTALYVRSFFLAVAVFATACKGQAVSTVKEDDFGYQSQETCEVPGATTDSATGTNQAATDQTTGEQAAYGQTDSAFPDSESTAQATEEEAFFLATESNGVLFSRKLTVALDIQASVPVFGAAAASTQLTLGSVGEMEIRVRSAGKAPCGVKEGQEVFLNPDSDVTCSGRVGLSLSSKSDTGLVVLGTGVKLSATDLGVVSSDVSWAGKASELGSQIRTDDVIRFCQDYPNRPEQKQVIASNMELSLQFLKASYLDSSASSYDFDASSQDVWCYFPGRVPYQASSYFYTSGTADSRVSGWFGFKVSQLNPFGKTSPAVHISNLPSYGAYERELRAGQISGQRLAAFLNEWGTKVDYPAWRLSGCQVGRLN